MPILVPFSIERYDFLIAGTFDVHQVTFTPFRKLIIVVATVVLGIIVIPMQVFIFN